MSFAIELRQLSKIFQEGQNQRQLLKDVNLILPGGKFSVLWGPSGSGKSTILNLISGLDLPTSGEVWLGDICLTQLSETDRTLFRRQYLGIIFQFFNLIPTLSVLDNILLTGVLNRQAEISRAKELLAAVGLRELAQSAPDKLSGGEQQRVALARALMHDPAVILADEPTGSLDETTGEQVFKLLLDLTRQAQKTLVMVTHNPEIAKRADLVYRLEQGKFVPGA